MEGSQNLKIETQWLDGTQSASRYEVAIGRTIKELTQDVEQMVAKGYQPTGGVAFVGRSTFLQAMVKPQSRLTPEPTSLERKRVRRKPTRIRR